MKISKLLKKLCLLGGVLFAGAFTSQAAVTGQWDFESADLSATVGGDLQYLGNAAAGTEFNSASGFSLPALSGGDANVMKFPANTAPDAYSMPTPPSANGTQDGFPDLPAGELVNDWTLLIDVLYPLASDASWRAIIETDGRLTPDADFFVNPDNAIGIGQYDGNVAPDTWYRIGLVVDGSAGVIRKYIDGEEVGVQNLPVDQDIGTLDGRWALLPAGIAELFTDNDGDVAEGFVSSIQLRDTALNAGQMLALGASVSSGVPQTIPPVPPYLETRTPGANDNNASPVTPISALLNQGDSTIVQSSIKLIVDGVEVAATVSSFSPFDIQYQETDPYKPLSDHTVAVEYSTGGAPESIEWNFSVPNYQDITLPAPILVENFDATVEGGIPTGWTLTNRTDSVVAGPDLANINSDSYLDWATIATSRLQAFGFGGRRYNQPTIILNGEIVDSLTTDNLIYAESDQRGGNQVQVAISPDYDMTGNTDVFLVFNSMYEQNQDSSGFVEYSVDGGTTWLPVLLMIDQDDIILDGEEIDAVATLNEVRTDQAHGLSYGTWLGGPVTAELAPYISGRVNDDSFESKRIEVHRLPAADNAPAVRLRFAQSGTASWYWAIDDVGFYAINTPIISDNPISQKVLPGAAVEFSVVASSTAELSYEWTGPNGVLTDGGNISGATTSTLSILGAFDVDAGTYTAAVSNSSGTANSAPALLEVVYIPEFTEQPIVTTVTVGDPAVLTVAAVGGVTPITYQWFKGEGEGRTAIPGATGAQFTIASASASDGSDVYSADATNASGTSSSDAALLLVVPPAPVTGDIVGQWDFATGDLSPTFGGAITYSDGDSGATDAETTFGTTTSYTIDAIDGVEGNVMNFTAASGPMGYIAPISGVNGGDGATLLNVYTLGFDILYQGDAVWRTFAQIDALDNSNDGEFFINTGNAIGVGTTGYHGEFTANVWHRVVMVIDQSEEINQVRYFIDGVFVGAGSGGEFDGRFGINKAINFFGDNGGDAYPGFISSIQVRNRAISDLEAIALDGPDAAGFPQTIDTSFAPIIVSEPVNTTVTPGQTLTLSVDVLSGTAVTYQWKLNGAIIPGATGSTHTVATVLASEAGNYTVDVTNADGTVTSSVALVKVPAIADDLVLHLTFDTDLNDSSGNGNNATQGAGTTPLTTGIIGNALGFSTTTAGRNYITLGAPADLNFGFETDFSIGFWFKFTTRFSDPAVISNKDWGSGSNQGWIVAPSSSGLKWNVADSNGTRKDSPGLGTLNDGQWHHYLASFDRDGLALTFIDGQHVNTVDISGMANTVDTPAGLSVNIGEDGTGTYNDITSGSPGFPDAMIDDLGIWRRLVTAPEAASIHQQGLAGNTLTSATGETLGEVSYVPAGGANLQLDWRGQPGAVVQRADVVTGPWTTVPGTDGLSTYTTSEPGYYRVVMP